MLNSLKTGEIPISCNTDIMFHGKGVNGKGWNRVKSVKLFTKDARQPLYFNFISTRPMSFFYETAPNPPKGKRNVKFVKCVEWGQRHLRQPSKAWERDPRTSNLRCRYRRSDTPSLMDFLLVTVSNWRWLDMKGQTFKIISHPSKRLLDKL